MNKIAGELMFCLCLDDYPIGKRKKFHLCLSSQLHQAEREGGDGDEEEEEEEAASKARGCE